MERQSSAVHQQVARHLQLPGAPVSANWVLQPATGEGWWSASMFSILAMDAGAGMQDFGALLERVHPDDRERLQQSYQRLLAGGGAVESEHRVVRASGAVRLLHHVVQLHTDSQGRALVLGTVIDITESRRQQERLQHNESLVHFASVLARMGAWDITLPDFRVIWSSDLCQILGLPDDYSPTLDESMAFYQGESHDRMRRVFNECVQNGMPWDQEFLFHGAGVRRWVRVLGQAVRDPAGTIVRVRGALQDITDRKGPEEQAHALAARLANTLESIGDGFVTIDTDWRITYVNAEAERLLNQPRETLVGHNLWQRFPETRNSIFETEYRRCMDQHQPVAFQQYYGELAMWLEVRAFRSDDGLAVYFRDVTEQKEAQEAIRSSSERFRMVARATTDIVWDWDLVSDRLWWNENMKNLFGHDPAQLEPDGRSWTRHIHPDDAKRVLASFDQALQGSANVWQDEYSFIRNDGTVATVLDRAFILRDQHGRAVRMTGSMVDLTSRKQSMDELARLNRALRLRSEFDQVIRHQADIAKLFQQVCELAVNTGEFSFCWIGLTVAEGKERLRVAASCGAQVLQNLLVRQRVVRDSDIEWRSPAARVIVTGQEILLDDVTVSGMDEEWIRIITGAGIESLVYLPLKDQDRTFGMICLASNGPLSERLPDVGHLRELANTLSNGVVSLKTRHERRKIEQALVNVAANVTSTTGNDFFIHLTQSMATATGARCAVVARLQPGRPGYARTLAAVESGTLLENFEYRVDGTPCRLLQANEEWLVPDEMARHYPAFELLARLPVRSYAGRRLDNAKGQPVGLLFLLFDAPLLDKELVTTMLRIFAGRAAAEMERQDAEWRIRQQASLLDNAQDAMIVRDLDYLVSYWNKGAERLYGWSAEEALGKSLVALLRLQPAEAAQAEQEVRTHGKWHGEMTEYRKDGSSVITEGQWTLVCDERGTPVSVFAIKTDITPRKAAEEEIRKLAFFDPLTGLPNRRLLTDRLAMLSRKGGQQPGRAALMFLDLDQFKALNDTLGHQTGDQILRMVGQRLKRLLRKADTVARLGGDEFVILLQDLHEDRERAMLKVRAIGEKILAAFASPFSVSGKDYFSTPSIGVAMLERDESRASAHDLLRRADLAMYQAKASGRNAIRFYDPTIEASFTRRLQIESDLRAAIHNNEFSLYYQQQVDVTGQPFGAEALLRWRRTGEARPMPPEEFIPIAEASGLIIPLGRWVLRTACAELARWAASPRTARLRMAVNISALQLQQKNFVDEVLSATSEAGVDPSRLELEITETALIDNIHDTIAKMAALRDAGVLFSLDDFGTGYSSLSYLRQLPIHQLKIDRSFVRDALSDPNDAIIVRTIIALASSLGLEVMGEGVETEQQRAFLESVGCLRYQGFLFGHPLGSEDLWERFAGQTSESV